MTERSWLEGGGELAALFRAKDWSETPLGPMETWPQSLRVAVRMMLASRYAMWLGWGPELTFLYNDAYAKATLGAKHPWALGRPAREVWAEIWPEIGPRIERVLTTRTATWDEGLQLFLERSGFPEETYHTFSYSPLFDDRGDVGGMFCVVTEETARVLGERQLALLRELAAELATTRTEDEVAAAATRSLGARPQDVPFALIYAYEGDEARLFCAVGAPEVAGDVWPRTTGFSPSGRAEARPTLVDDLASRFERVPRGPWDKPPERAIVIPIARQGERAPGGFLVAGINPYRLLDREYAGFIELLAGQIASGLANARAYEAQRRRAEELAELDRAKTLFFTNISHEFRTPLTLMLGPVSDLVEQAESAGRADAELLRIVQRHTLRLLKLVNTLLDFSRIEARGSRARFIATDLGTVTAELASMFRAAVEKAGMRLIVDTPASASRFFVDREMWEKIVLNLLSNAFKFTLEGEIEVSLHDRGDAAVLTVRDTGSGIPARELPRLFDRFHRVEGTRRRSHEGTGIGLALVQELVKQHGGTIAVETEEGVGSTFTVTIPAGSAHLPPAQIADETRAAVKAPTAEMYVDEVTQWLGSEPTAPVPETVEEAAGERPRIVLADDNADMREYVRHLLAPQFDVEAVGDGAAALEAVRRRRPDLLLTDVMMPELDGFGLLAAIRSAPETRDLPVIMLSARAGEESRIEGVEAGADDYLVKPFSARELLARAGMQIRMAAMRREAFQREQHLRAEMENILESMADAFVACDAEWRITYLNAAAEAIYHRSRAELLGRVLWEVFPSDTAAEGPFRRAMQERVPVKSEFCYEQNGSWFEADVFPVEGGGVAIYGRDITQRKRAEEALRESEELFRTLGEAVPDFLWMADAQGRPIYRNPAWTRYTGLVTETSDAAEWASVVHPDDLPSLRESWHEAVTKVQPFSMEARFRRHDGVYCWFSGRAVPLRNEDGSPRRWVGTVTDIDDRKRMEDGLRAADRMKDEFVATLSHELRTPLTSILGWTQLLLSDVFDATDSRNAIAAIERAAKVQAQLVEDVLDVSRITTGRMRIEVEPTDLAAVMDAALETVKPAADAKTMTLGVSLDRSIGEALLDGGRVQQIVWNLLSNAIKFSPAGTAVHVALRKEGSVAVIEVQDHGPGIAPELLPHVFERFWQADSSSRRTHAGLGLGLALVRHLTELHGGSVEVESAVGAGSLFRVTLPLLSVPRTGAGAGSAEGGKRGRLDFVHVLFVDDLEDTRNLFSTMLRQEGAEVTTSASVEEARARLQSARPEIVLTDIAMPGADGYDLLREIRREHPRLPVVAVTAHATASSPGGGADAFDAWLPKPVTQDAMAETILRVLRAKQT